MICLLSFTRYQGLRYLVHDWRWSIRFPHYSPCGPSLTSELLIPKEDATVSAIRGNSSLVATARTWRRRRSVARGCPVAHLRQLTSQTPETRMKRQGELSIVPVGSFNQCYFSKASTQLEDVNCSSGVDCRRQVITVAVVVHHRWRILRVNPPTLAASAPPSTGPTLHQTTAASSWALTHSLASQPLQEAEAALPFIVCFLTAQCFSQGCLAGLRLGGTTVFVCPVPTLLSSSRHLRSPLNFSRIF